MERLKFNLIRNKKKNDIFFYLNIFLIFFIVIEIGLFSKYFYDIKSKNIIVQNNKDIKKIRLLINNLNEIKSVFPEISYRLSEIFYVLENTLPNNVKIFDIKINEDNSLNILAVSKDLSSLELFFKNLDEYLFKLRLISQKINKNGVEFILNGYIKK